jgi:hypothetical protein
MMHIEHEQIPCNDDPDRCYVGQDKRVKFRSVVKHLMHNCRDNLPIVPIIMNTLSFIFQLINSEPIWALAQESAW